MAQTRHHHNVFKYPSYGNRKQAANEFMRLLIAALVLPGHYKSPVSSISGSPCVLSFDLTATSPSPPPPLHHSHKMSSYLRNLFGGQGQSSKAQGESRSRSRPPPAVAYSHKSSKLATSESTPRSAGVKRSHSATRSHVPSPLRDVTNEGSQRPTLQRSNTSRSHSKSKPSNSHYNGPGTGELYPDFVRPCVD